MTGASGAESATVVHHPTCPACGEEVALADGKRACDACMAWYHEACHTAECAGCATRAASARCPYCHDALVRTSPKAGCSSCLAFQHAGCWEEHGRCAACERRPAVPPLPASVLALARADFERLLQPFQDFDPDELPDPGFRDRWTLLAAFAAALGGDRQGARTRLADRATSPEFEVRVWRLGLGLPESFEPPADAPWSEHDAWFIPILRGDQPPKSFGADRSGVALARTYLGLLAERNDPPLALERYRAALTGLEDLPGPGWPVFVWARRRAEQLAAGDRWDAELTAL